MSTAVRSHHVDTAGGRIYYEVRGSGPLLLVIGHPMTSGPFGPLADLLADDYTVVTYDPHGLGESSANDPSLDLTPEIEADQLAAVVGAVGPGPADVFGSSGGAMTGLAFATRHPGKLGTLIAHEPPVTELLPDAPQIQAVVIEIENAYRAGEPGPAFQKFVGLIMHSGPVTDAGVAPVEWPPAGEAPAGQPDADENGEASASPPEPSAKQRADDEMFFLRRLPPVPAGLPARRSTLFALAHGWWSRSVRSPAPRLLDARPRRWPNGSVHRRRSSPVIMAGSWRIRRRSRKRSARSWPNRADPGQTRRLRPTAPPSRSRPASA